MTPPYPKDAHMVPREPETTYVDAPHVQAAADKWGEWDDQAWTLLTDELTRRKVTYKELARRLETLGISEDPASLTRKVSRKSFRAGFLLACMEALNVEITLAPREGP